ncbi:MAG: helix-turn-helix transcriptional regulator [Sphingomonadales bacterium]|nr:helix-turn-helix transcriptional regulator [Sphingomonadales bacterium]
MRVRTATDIGLIIRDRRRDRGWDQQTLADRVGVSRLWIGEIENGKPRAQLDLVLRTLAALDLPVDIGVTTPGSGKSRSAELIRQALEQL